MVRTASPSYGRILARSAAFHCNREGGAAGKLSPIMALQAASKTCAGKASERFLRKLVFVSAPSPFGWQTPSAPPNGCTTGVGFGKLGGMDAAGPGPTKGGGGRRGGDDAAGEVGGVAGAG